MVQTNINRNYPTNASAPRSWVLWVVGIQLLVLYGPTIYWLFQRWTMSVWHNAHGLLIAVVVMYYAWVELRNSRDRPVSENAWGFIFFVPAILLFVLDTGIHSQLLSAVSLYLLLPGLSLLFLGAERTKAIQFFLFMLFLSLPIPLMLTESLHLALRQIATNSTAWIVPKLGIPIFAEGTTLSIPNGTLQVADACSGFSTLYASIAVACISAYFCTGVKRRVSVMVAAVPIAIAANILRVVLLVILVHVFGVEILGTSLHTISGLFTFALALPIIFWLGSEPPAQEIKS